MLSATRDMNCGATGGLTVALKGRFSALGQCHGPSRLPGVSFRWYRQRYFANDFFRNPIEDKAGSGKFASPAENTRLVARECDK